MPGLIPLIQTTGAMYDIEKVNGRYFDFYLPENPTCCMTCMFTTMTCGTQKMSMKFYIDKDGVGKGTDVTACGCIRVSPVPCFMCCGYGHSPWSRRATARRVRTVMAARVLLAAAARAWITRATS